MNELDNQAFIQLFKDACEKCFGSPLKTTLTETESKLLCNTIIDKTGLIIGFKSIKNYSAYVVNEAPGKQENPSPATLDTLARYVLDAPYTDEIKRKKFESHYPYWFDYKNKLLQPTLKEEIAVIKKNRNKTIYTIAALLAILTGVVWLFIHRDSSETFTDNFTTTDKDSMAARGWMLNAEDTGFWGRRGETPNALTMFTLKGDNWPDTINKQCIKNLLVRQIPGDCFTAEVHLEKFIPYQNWQQAGILLMEDTSFNGRSMRLSIAYNDYMGGLPISRNIIIQAIASLGSNFSKPEEIAQLPLFNLDTAEKTPVILHSLDHAALRIEKKGSQFRLLYADGVSKTTAFKEIVSRDFDMKPRYIALFALKGFVDSTANMPVKFTFFKLTTNNCNE
ncbi:MAG TPA: hypothetical protein VG738_07230 [Chitinophagaceae bacterium]|nr:hypothetical protein [Chitinophagaceae bacterium]